MIAAIEGMDVADKRGVVRADLNVPMVAGRVTDATRITRFAGVMKGLLTKGAALVILSHFGRPKDGFARVFSLRHLREDLSAALGCPVGSARPDEAPEAARHLGPGQVLLVENIRLEAGEEKNDPALAARLAQLGDIYVNDAFSYAHRAHASTQAIAHLMPAAADPLVMEELTALEAPKPPSVAIVGGAKVSSRIALLKNLVAKADQMIVGGGMANTFLFADGAPMGKSRHEADQVATVAEIRALAKQHGGTINIPLEAVVDRTFAAHTPNEVVAAFRCPVDEMILDDGPAALGRFKAVLAGARTILWDGPLGAFEMPPFDRGTAAQAQVAADLTRAGLCTLVAGGGDTVAVLNAAKVADQFTYVSSAGGAFLNGSKAKPFRASRR